MKSLYHSNGNQEIISRIDRLSPASQAVWGKMNVIQMLAHCQQPLRSAYGELKLKRGLMSFLFGGMIKKKLMSDERPFDRNLPTDKNFIVANPAEFMIEKEKLIRLVKRFSETGPSGITTHPHPFFGKMSPEEWDVLQWKHLDHHLRQFGV